MEFPVPHRSEKAPAVSREYARNEPARGLTAISPAGRYEEPGAQPTNQPGTHDARDNGSHADSHLPKRFFPGRVGLSHSCLTQSMLRGAPRECCGAPPCLNILRLLQSSHYYLQFKSRGR